MKAAPISKILKILDRLYPNAKSALDFKTPLQALIAAILAAQCRDVEVNRLTPDLFKKYPRAQDYVRVPLEELQNEKELVPGTGQNSKSF